jgi:hypothetical protein
MLPIFKPVLFAAGFALIPLILTPSSTASNPVAEPPVPGSTALMALEEVNPGMRGEWRTVVRGTEVESFALEVVGVMDGFVAPDYPVILCEILDPDNRLTGPVAGMSGSPVLIEGRLAGAYAYGFPWSKGRVFVGVTPIELMVAMREKASPPPPTLASTGREDSLWGGRVPLAEMDRFVAGARPGPVSGPLALPLALSATGLADAARRELEPFFRSRGLEMNAAPSGRSPREVGPPASELQPGSAVAAMLTTGDIRLGAVGTVTWREGDEILAFGHRFIQGGAVTIPLATAEVVDVVGSYQRSFKLSNLGEVVGVFDLDLAQGVRGTIGGTVPQIPISVRVRTDDAERVYEGTLLEDRELTPFAAIVYLAQAMLGQPGGVDRQTVAGTVRVNLAGEDPLIFGGEGLGFEGALSVMLRTLWTLGVLYENPFEFPVVEGVEIEVTLERGRDLVLLRALELTRRNVPAGEVLSGWIRLSPVDRGSEIVTVPFQLAVPPGLRPGDYRLVLADRATVEEMEGAGSPYDAGSYPVLIDRLRLLRTHADLYLRLVGPDEGFRLEGVDFSSLPASVRHLYASPKAGGRFDSLRERVWAETILSVDGLFRGQYEQEVTILPRS